MLDRTVDLGSVFDRLQALGVDGISSFQRSARVPASDDRLEKLKRVHVKTIDNLTMKVVVICRRLRQVRHRRPDGGAELQMLLNLTRAFSTDQDLRLDHVYVSYFNNMQDSNLFQFEVTNPQTNKVKVSLTIHLD